LFWYLFGFGLQPFQGIMFIGHLSRVFLWFGNVLTALAIIGLSIRVVSAVRKELM
jgi:hypothetical protein